MCRIYGYLNAFAAPNALRAVAAIQRHGGPDGTGTARDQGWALGNNRLAVVDLDGGRQPYRLGEGITAVFNGEIYNADELRGQLRAKGYTFEDRCDGGVIPALYDAYGDDFLSRLDGMYSLALVDRRNGRPRLLLATDHLGMKPLYYRWDPGSRSLHFSSEIPALLAFSTSNPSLWEPGLDAYLSSRTPFGEQTMFAGVRVLPPATSLVCELGGVPELVRRSGAAEDGVGIPYFGDHDEAAAGADVRARLRQEVGRLMVADVPVAVITSGGLDSSLITALAAQHAAEAGRPRVHSFNIAYRGAWSFDERHFAREAATRAGTVHHQVEIDPADFPSLIEDTVWHLGQPNADPIALSTGALFAAVRKAGFKVALTGDAADEVFGGYDRMLAAVAAGTDHPDGDDWFQPYLDSLAVLPARLRHRLYTEEYRTLVADYPALPEGPLETLRHGSGSRLRRITDFELGQRFPAYHLRRVDHLSMAHSVEVRLPFGQRSVLAVGRALPDALRIRDGRVKRALYSAAAGLLPQSVLDRPKQPFTLPIVEMLAPGLPLWDFARDVLHRDRLAAGGQLDPREVRGLFTTQAQRPDATTALTLWALLIHEVWREQFGAVRTEALAVAA
ncbi:asparagine synthase (glutamine-hydrolyzing) [Streptacidiphilus pinicola]|uniref:asparagine synthase (glutamine-hydrolyzing) n=1 Tax=Streptacidiphilus pinicola TaxID=2219663 RepID=A0A2X0IE94_9ACTN|nr:asparagine synthase (glutamine-hydrolyzing) [Streptacidiphilus pinicola]RAG83304.1 asparagine synthase (glutamine-hydrolyzing) [Streptacidiphilus pinicola]